VSDDARLSGDLNRGRLLVRMVMFGVPLVLGMFFHSLFNLIDLLIVGKLGPYALAAVNQASIVAFIPQLLGTGVNNASIAVISRNFGMRNYNRANANAIQGFLLLAMMAVVLGVPGYLYARELNMLIGSEADALGPATEYLKISSAGMFTMFALMQVTACLRSGGNARWPMILLIGANVFNGFLTWAMVYGWWLFPAMGVVGASWATVVARGVFALFGLYLVTRRSAPVRIVGVRLKFRPRMIFNLARIGIPSSLQFVVRVLAYGAILNLINRFGHGQAMHAALAVGFRLDMLATFTGVGWGAASAAMVGQALGANQPKRARAAGWLACLLDAITMASIGVFFFLFAPWLLAVFGRDPDVDARFLATHHFGVEYLRIAVFGYVFQGVGLTLAQALNGAGSTKTPLFLDALGFLGVQVPLTAHICFHATRYHPTQVWWSLVATAGLVAALYATVWNRGHWKHKRIQ